MGDRDDFCLVAANKADTHLVAVEPDGQLGNQAVTGIAEAGLLENRGHHVEGGRRTFAEFFIAAVLFATPQHFEPARAPL